MILYLWGEVRLLWLKCYNTAEQIPEGKGVLTSLSAIVME